MNFLDAIDISMFKNYSQKRIEECLCRMKQNYFQIVIPKKFPDFNSADIAMSYYSGAYIGQLLKDISSSFAYYIPSPQKASDFIFEIEATGMDKLAGVIEFLIRSFFDTGKPEDHSHFDMMAANYGIACCTRKRKSDCPGLLSIAIRYMYKDDKE